MSSADATRTRAAISFSRLQMTAQAFSPERAPRLLVPTTSAPTHRKRSMRSSEPTRLVFVKAHESYVFVHFFSNNVAPYKPWKSQCVNAKEPRPETSANAEACSRKKKKIKKSFVYHFMVLILAKIDFWSRKLLEPMNQNVEWQNL